VGGAFFIPKKEEDPGARKVDVFLFKSLHGLIEQINASIQRGCSNCRKKKDEPNLKNLFSPDLSGIGY
jgi:hypothetical protein